VSGDAWLLTLAVLVVAIGGRKLVLGA